MDLRAYEAELIVENSLSFRANEYGNIIRTSRLIHNFALRFALNGIRGNPSKDHLENLHGCPIYATPAVPVDVRYEFQTFHPFPEAPQLFKDASHHSVDSLKTYQSENTILHHKEVVVPGSRFRFAVASTTPLPEEIVIPLGWKGSLQKVVLNGARLSDPQVYAGPVNHPMNPLDFDDEVVMKPAISHIMQPSPLFEGRLVRPIRCRIIRTEFKEFHEYLVPSEW